MPAPIEQQQPVAHRLDECRPKAFERWECWGIGVA
jgi:hypothetical protein